MVVDGNEGKEYWAVSEPVFSPNGQRVAYRACLTKPKLTKITHGRWAKANEVVVVDGEESQVHACDLSRNDFNSNWLVPSIVFSPDGKRVAYAASASETLSTSYEVGKKFIVIDGKAEDASFDGIAGLSFSPDGKRIAFAAKRGPDIVAVIDGVEHRTNIQGRFPLNPVTVGAPIFSPDSRQVAYVRSRGTVGKKFWKGKSGGELQIVVNGVASETFDRIADLVWESPTTLRTVACRGNRCFRIELEMSQEEER